MVFKYDAKDVGVPSTLMAGGAELSWVDETARPDDPFFAVETRTMGGEVGYVNGTLSNDPDEPFASEPGHRERFFGALGELAKGKK
jgi:hypothetical protein